MINGFGSLEGRSFIIGREGHVLVDDPSVSKEHAELKFVGGKIMLRDLNSTNGLFLITGNKARRFREGYVLPSHEVSIGAKRTTVQSLLDTVYSMTHQPKLR